MELSNNKTGGGGGGGNPRGLLYKIEELGGCPNHAQIVANEGVKNNSMAESIMKEKIKRRKVRAEGQLATSETSFWSQTEYLDG